MTGKHSETKELCCENIPAQPDSTELPALSRAWTRMFGSSLEWVKPELKDLYPDTGPTLRDFWLSPARDNHEFLRSGTTRFGKSRNWCGATIVPNGGNQFVQVYGEWRVPKVDVPHNGGSKQYFSSTWIGIDGDRRYLNSTLPQVGTQQNTDTAYITPSSAMALPPNYAWFQWWAPHRILPNLFWIQGISINPGDDVMGLVWVRAPSEVTVFFCNLSTKMITCFSKDAPPYLNQQGAISTPYFKPHVSGASADWIVERPTEDIQATAGWPKLLPLADFKEVVFRNCVAGSADGMGPPTGEKVLTSPRFKRMYDVLENPTRTRILSLPRRGDDLSELRIEQCYDTSGR